MRTFLCLTRKELGDLFTTAPLLLAGAFFVLLDSFAFYLTATRQAVVHAVFDDMAIFMLFTSLLFYPLASMNTFAAENAHGTLETLLTAPVSLIKAVMAKFTAGMVFAAVYLLHGLVYAFLLASGGKLDWPATAAAFLALYLVAALALSLGMFVSANTLSPAAAAAAAGGVLVFLALAADVDPYAGGLGNLLYSLSFVPHAKRFIAGELDSRGLVYFLSVTALLLFYCWLSLKSLTPDKIASNPVSRRRMRVTYILVLASLLLILAQAAILHVNGFWESPTPMGPALARVPRLWLAPLALAALCMVWGIMTYRAARRAERLPRLRRRRYATISETRVMGASRFYYDESLRQNRRAFLTAVAALVVVLNVNWLSHYPFRTFSDSGWLRPLALFGQRSWDVSENRRNSLSPTTLRVLDSLQGRLEIYSFLADDDGRDGVPAAIETRRLLERYADYNGLVSPAYADRRREPELAASLAQSLGMAVDAVANTLVVQYHGRRMTIPESALASPLPQRDGGAPSAWVFDGENRITQAILRLSDPRVPGVLFTVGHQELGLSGPYAERAASQLARILAGANMRVRQYALDPARPIPPDCDILVVASPRTTLAAAEAELIRNYLDSGGRLLMLAPPPGAEDFSEDSPLNRLLYSLGGSFRDEFADGGAAATALEAEVVGRARTAFGESAALLYFPQARTIRDNPRAREDGWVVERLVESGPGARGIAPGGAATRPGPFTLAYRSRRGGEAGEARAAVLGSGRLAADSDINRGANALLLMNLMQWLAGREEARDIAPTLWIDRRLDLVGPRLRAILWIGVVALPLLWLAAGISAWWLRQGVSKNGF